MADTLYVKVSPAYAQQIIMESDWSFQRPITKSKVATLASDMTAGRWEPFCNAIEIVQNGVGKWVVNGQHRLHAIVESGAEVEMTIIVHHGTREDAVRKYRVYDQQNRRTFADVATTLEDFPKSWKAEMGAAVKIISAIERGSTMSWGVGMTMTLTELDEAARPWKEFYSMWREVRGDNDYSYIFDNAPTVAAAMYTLRHANDAAREFWSNSVTGNGAPFSGPRKLRDFLFAVRTGITTSGGNIQQMRMRACSICWNAAQAGTEIKQLKLDRKDYKITFAGTPLAK